MSVKLVVFDEQQNLSGRYDSAIHGKNVPGGAVEISDELFLRTINETDGVWRLVDGEVVKSPFPKIEPNYPALFAAERFRHETSAIFVEALNIETTRDSQALIASTGLSAIFDPDYRCNFKTLDGFVEIGAEQIIAIAKAVRAHVQACFDRELDLLQAFEAGTYKDEMLAVGWPA
ncbi:DUF4376 domain-containing protein [Pseudomonas fluorescens]|uniref:DUF4376 domain-containing protein n=1 Tax=Pseudomonas TaxID=286 RepID=UPI001F027F71|nr:MULTISPECIES: DUF4376 domain-containing protein [Pseudomonas]